MMLEFCQISARDIDRIPFQWGEKLPENGERNWKLNPIRRSCESWIVLK
jgi:hypothetical protein